MEKKQLRRGRPPKSPERIKGEYLDIRVGAAEKKSFREAAELAGLDLSAWVRERLRSNARRELESAGRPIAFMNRAKPDQVLQVSRVGTTRLSIRFGDGFSGIWSLRQLELDPKNLDLESLKPAKAGTNVRAKTKLGETIYLDSSWLRAAIDPVYDTELERSLLALRS